MSSASLIALVLYSNAALGAVMSSAVVLNLIVAGLAGVAIGLITAPAGQLPNC